jgi:hypothetical protein
MWNWTHLGIFFALSLLVCLCGFKKYVYFMSIGYGFSVAVIGAAMAVLSLTGAYTGVGIAHFIQFALFVIYGFRLSGFLLIREIKNAAYRKTLAEATGDEIPVFVKAGAIVPMGPEVNYADEYPRSPLTLDIYPKGTTTYTLYEDDGESRKYQTENAYATTTYACEQVDGKITLKIGERFVGNPEVFTPVDRSYDLIFHHMGKINSVKLDGVALKKYTSDTAARIPP